MFVILESSCDTCESTLEKNGQEYAIIVSMGFNSKASYTQELSCPCAICASVQLNLELHLHLDALFIQRFWSKFAFLSPHLNAFWTIGICEYLLSTLFKTF